MTDTKKPNTTVAQDVAALRAIAAGAHATPETPAEVRKPAGVIETHHNDGPVEWGYSFTTHNPDPEDYVRCYSEQDAWRLADRLSRSLAAGKAEHAVPPADPAKASGSAPDGWREFLDWCAANVSVSRGRAVFNDQEAFRSRLHAMRTATPPASAPEVTEFDVASVEKSFTYDAAARTHTPVLIVKFAPVHADHEEGDDKGWRDRDAFAAALQQEPRHD